MSRIKIFDTTIMDKLNAILDGLLLSTNFENFDIYVARDRNFKNDIRAIFSEIHRKIEGYEIICKESDEFISELQDEIIRYKNDTFEVWDLKDYKSHKFRISKSTSTSGGCIAMACTNSRTIEL